MPHKPRAGYIEDRIRALEHKFEIMEAHFEELKLSVYRELSGLIKEVNRKVELSAEISEGLSRTMTSDVTSKQVLGLLEIASRNAARRRDELLAIRREAYLQRARRRSPIRREARRVRK